jgi:hypothetical protein
MKLIDRSTARRAAPETLEYAVTFVLIAALGVMTAITVLSDFDVVARRVAIGADGLAKQVVSIVVPRRVR